MKIITNQCEPKALLIVTTSNMKVKEIKTKVYRPKNI